MSFINFFSYNLRLQKIELSSPYILCLFILPSRLVMTVYDSACTASFTHLQSAVRNGQTSVTVNGFVLAVMVTGKIFLTGYDKETALLCT